MDIITYALAKKFAKEYTDSEIEKLEGISYEIVDHLPDVGDEQKIYLVPAGAGNDSYEEYIYINGTFERLGYLDLSEYVKKVMIANMYSNEATYAVGDVVINEDILYECKVAINVPEEFNGEHWDEIILQDEIDNLKNTKQDNLVNQVNIKSINNNSLLGSGNLNIVAKHTFESSWPTTGTTVDFCTSIVNDASAVPGMIYMGKLSCSDLPGGLAQGEATVEIISEDSNGKAIRITLTSVDTSPYRWEYERAKVNGSYVTPGWKGYQIEITNNNKLSSDLVSDSGHTNKFVTASEKTTWDGKQDALVSGTNIKTINSSSLLGSGDIDTKELFYCTYDTTTYSEITEALAIGKLPVVNRNNKTYLYQYTRDGSHDFTCIDNLTLEIHQCYVTTYNQWFSGDRRAQPIITTNNKLGSDLVSDSGNTNKFVTASEKTAWNGKQDALATQTAYTAQGSATKVPQITTNTLGQVTNITEVDITDNNDNQKVKTSSVTFGDNDVVEIVGGNNVTITGNANDSTITIAATDTTYGVATASTAGLVKSSTTGTTALRDYNVEVNNDGTMKVNVPWVDTSITSANLEEFDVDNGYLSEKYTVIGSSRVWSDVTIPLSPSVPLYNIVKNAIPLLPPENIIKIEELLDASFDDLGATGKCLIDETLNNGTTAQCLGTQRTDLNSGSLVWSNNNIYYIAVVSGSTFEFYRLTYDYSNYVVEANTGIYRLMFDVSATGSLINVFNLYFDYASLLDGLQTLAQSMGLPSPTKIELDELKTLFDNMTDTEKCGVIGTLMTFAFVLNYSQDGTNWQYPIYDCGLNTSTGDFSITYKEGDSPTTIFNVSDVTNTSYDISLIANVGGLGSGSGSVTPTDIELNLQRWEFKLGIENYLYFYTCFDDTFLTQLLTAANTAIDDFNTEAGTSLPHLQSFEDLSSFTAELYTAGLTSSTIELFVARFIYTLYIAGGSYTQNIRIGEFNSFDVISITSVNSGNTIVNVSINYLNTSGVLTTQSLDASNVRLTASFEKLKGEGVASGSGSSSASAQKLVKLTFTDLDMRGTDASNADIKDFKMYCTKERWDNFVALAKSTYDIDITYSNFETFFKNATMNGQSLAIGYLLYDYITDVALPEAYVIDANAYVYNVNAGFNTYPITGTTEKFVTIGEWRYSNSSFTSFPSVDRSSVPYATASTTVTAEEIDSNVMSSGSSGSSSGETTLDRVKINCGPGFSTSSSINFTFERTQFDAFLTQVNAGLAQQGVSITVTRENFNTVVNQLFNDTSISSLQKIQVIVLMASCQISSYYYDSVDGFVSNNLLFGLLNGIKFDGSDCNIFDNTDSLYNRYGFISIELL